MTNEYKVSTTRLENVCSVVCLCLGNLHSSCKQVAIKQCAEYKQSAQNTVTDSSVTCLISQL